MGTLNNFLQVASLILVIFISPSGGIVRNDDQGPVVRDVHVFEESVRFEDTTFAAPEFASDSDRPVYVRRSRVLYKFTVQVI